MIKFIYNKSLHCILIDAYAPPDLMTQIKNAKYSFSSRVWKTVSDTAKNLIEKMLQKDPQKRVSIEEILAHNWLKCPSTRERLEKVYKKNGIDLDETDLELTLVNVTLNEIVVKEPPLKKRRVC
jgi:serine/threonine protein kinase